jgi:hypothetical protein
MGIFQDLQNSHLSYLLGFLFKQNNIKREAKAKKIPIP